MNGESQSKSFLWKDRLKKRKIQILKYGCWVFKVAYDVALVFVYIPLWLRVSVTFSSS